MEVAELRIKKLAEFAKVHSLEFSNYENLDSAFTHSSYTNAHPDLEKKCYEVLEFLGDAVLELVVSKFLCNNFPDADEGELTEKRNVIVSGESFAKCAKKLNFGHLILFSDGFLHRKFSQHSILACVFEALFGAIYTDLGFEACEKFYLDNFREYALEKASIAHEANFRATLQEYTQSKDGSLPEFVQLEDTFDELNNTIFNFNVFWKGNFLGTGSGTSKKIAMANAAKNAVEFLKEKGELW